MITGLQMRKSCRFKYNLWISIYQYRYINFLYWILKRNLDYKPRTDRPSTSSAALALYGNYGKYKNSSKHPPVRSNHASKRATKIETSPTQDRKTETENQEIFGKYGSENKNEMATLGIAGNRVRALSDTSVVDRFTIALISLNLVITKFFFNNF